MKSIFKSIIISLVIILCIINVSNAQVKVGANPANISTNSNLEVEAANGNKTIVDKATGQVTIQDGTQGTDKILTSDANGASSWKSSSDAGIVKMLFGAQRVAVQAVAQNNNLTILAFDADFDDNSGWNATAKEYTIAEGGYYLVALSGKLKHVNYAASMPGGFFIQINRNGTWLPLAKLAEDASPGFDRALGGSTVVKVDAGTKIRIIGNTCACNTTTASWTASDMALSVSRMR